MKNQPGVNFENKNYHSKNIILQYELHTIIGKYANFIKFVTLEVLS